jgi:hypothetical protein
MQMPLRQTQDRPLPTQECEPLMVLMTLMNANAFAAQKCHPQMTQMTQIKCLCRAKCKTQMAQMTLINAGIYARELASDHPNQSPLSPRRGAGGEAQHASDSKRPSQPVISQDLPPLGSPLSYGEGERG